MAVKTIHVGNPILIIQSIFGLTMVSAVTSIVLFYRALNYLIVANNSIQTTTEFSGSFLQIHKELQARTAKATVTTRKRNTLKSIPKISFNNVTFCYSGLNNKPILNQLNFEIIPQTTTIFVGGSGKGNNHSKPDYWLATTDEGKIFFGKFAHTSRQNVEKEGGFVSQDPLYLMAPSEITCCLKLMISQI